MTAITSFLLTLGGCAAGVTICGIFQRFPDMRSVRALVALALVAIVGASLLAVFMPRPDCYHPHDVQAVWLDGAWRCITEEEAG